MVARKLSLRESAGEASQLIAREGSGSTIISSGIAHKNPIESSPTRSGTNRASGWLLMMRVAGQRMAGP